MIALGTALVIGTGLKLISDVIGTGLQRGESKRAQGIADRYRSEDLALIKEQQAYERGETERKWKWMEEGRNYGRAMDLVGNLNSMMNKDLALKKNLTNIWRQ